MKKKIRQLTLGCALIYALLTTTTASAYYIPSAQRWVNRDPINELGGVNLYQFVRNQPAGRHDNFGLIGVPGSIDCDGLLQQIEQLESDIAEAAAEGQDDAGMYANLAALQAQYAANCSEPAPPPEPAPKFCPIRVPPQPPNPYQNNRGSFCSRHPVLCVGVGVGIGVGVGCALAPEACAVFIRVGIGIVRGAAPIAAAAAGG